MTLECESDMNGRGYECGGPNDPKENSITAVGPVSFAIKMRNELAGTEVFEAFANWPRFLSINVNPATAVFVTHSSSQLRLRIAGQTNRIILPYLIAITLAMVLLAFDCTFCQDIRGGASLLFQHHNPPVRGRQDSKRSAKQAAPNTLRSDQSSESSSKSLQDQDINFAVEEALALGNSARDDKPPRYQDAERLYRLAAKLDPKDRRPHIGLGNVFYDQKHYAEAAEAGRKPRRKKKL